MLVENQKKKQTQTRTRTHAQIATTLTMCDAYENNITYTYVYIIYYKCVCVYRYNIPHMCCERGKHYKIKSRSPRRADIKTALCACKKYFYILFYYNHYCFIVSHKIIQSDTPQICSPPFFPLLINVFKFGFWNFLI